MENLFIGSAQRFVEAFIASSPTLLVGFLIAGVLRRLLGYENTRKLFGEGTRRAILQAWLLGMLLPVCSLGVIPVVREMKRAGVSGGTILAFGLTAPLFNPISVLYGLTLSDPIVVLTFSFGSLVIVTAIGMGWNKFFSDKAEPVQDDLRIKEGWQRLASIGSYCCRESMSASMIYIVLGLIGVAAMSAFLPSGYLQTAANSDDIWAPAFMAGVAFPAYLTPMAAMVRLAEMFAHGNSVGAAFALLTLGAGVNLGLYIWMIRSYGFLRSSSWILLMGIIVIGLAYGIDRPLRPKGIDAVGHTHAFDQFCNPFTYNTQDPLKASRQTVAENIEGFEIVSLGVLAVWMLLGFLALLFDRANRLDGWLASGERREVKWDFSLSPRILGTVSLLGLVALSVVGCYVYYPPPEQVMAEIKMINADVFVAANSADWDAAEFLIPIYDDWTRKLEVGVALRGHRRTEEQKRAAIVLRERLEELKHTIEWQNAEEAQELAREISRGYRDLRSSYDDIITAKTNE